MARSASPRAALRSKPDHFVPPDVGSSVQPYQEQGAKERECARESRRSAPRKPLPSGISSGRPALDPIVARHLTMPPFCPAAALSEAYREVYEAARDQKRRRRRRQTVEVRATIDPASAVSQAEFLLLPGGSAESVYYRDAAPNPSPTKPPPPSRNSRNSRLNPRRLELRVRCRYPKRAEHR
jgi:hypothetical protein